MNKITNTFILCLGIMISHSAIASEDQWCQCTYNTAPCSSNGIDGGYYQCKANLHYTNGEVDSNCECECITDNGNGTNLGTQHVNPDTTTRTNHNC